LFDILKSPPLTEADLNAMVVALEASQRFRVLRRLEPRSPRPVPEGVKTRQGLYVDVETTGLEPARQEIIELAMAPFT
jgi:DNA polymerase-3 subunit epsilon